MALNAHDVYRRQEVMGAGPVDLIVMLLREARRRALSARRDLEERRLEDAHRHLLRAQEIMYELRGALSMEVGDIAENLANIYDFILEGLLEANLRKRRDRLDDVIDILSSLASGWREVGKILARSEDARGTS